MLSYMSEPTKVPFQLDLCYYSCKGTHCSVSNCFNSNHLYFQVVSTGIGKHIPGLEALFLQRQWGSLPTAVAIFVAQGGLGY